MSPRSPQTLLEGKGDLALQPLGDGVGVGVGVDR